MIVYIVIGEVEGVYQDEIGGPFLSHPRKEIVQVFSSRETAENWVKNCKLSKPRKDHYGDTSYYRFGYYDMTVESHEVV
jgi:hypothetical protein